MTELLLGERIKLLRNQNNLTQDELANQLNVDRTTVGSWETNRREPDVTTLCKVADLFEVSLDWLIGRCTIRSFIPIYGTEDIFNLSLELDSDFCLRIPDDSFAFMGISSNDYGLFKQLTEISPGHLVAIKSRDSIELIPWQSETIDHNNLLGVLIAVIKKPQPINDLAFARQIVNQEQEWKDIFVDARESGVNPASIKQIIDLIVQTASSLKNKKAT